VTLAARSFLRISTLRGPTPPPTGRRVRLARPRGRAGTAARSIREDLLGAGFRVAVSATVRGQVKSRVGVLRVTGDCPSRRRIGSRFLRRARDGREKGRGSRVAVARRPSPVLTRSPSGGFARPVAADEFGPREEGLALGLGSLSAVRVHLARGPRGPRVASRESRAPKSSPSGLVRRRSRRSVSSGRTQVRAEGWRSEAQVEKASERQKAKRGSAARNG